MDENSSKRSMEDRWQDSLARARTRTAAAQSAQAQPGGAAPHPPHQNAAQGGAASAVNNTPSVGKAVQGGAAGAVNNTPSVANAVQGGAAANAEQGGATDAVNNAWNTFEQPVLHWHVPHGQSFLDGFPMVCEAQWLRDRGWFFSNGPPCDNPTIHDVRAQIPPGIPTEGPDYNVTPPPIIRDRSLTNPGLEGDGVNNCLVCAGPLYSTSASGNSQYHPRLCPWPDFKHLKICRACAGPLRSANAKAIADLPAEEKFDAIVLSTQSRECVCCLEPLAESSSITVDGRMCNSCSGSFGKTYRPESMPAAARLAKRRQICYANSTWRKEHRHLEPLFLADGAGDTKCAQCHKVFTDSSKGSEERRPSEAWVGVYICERCHKRNNTAKQVARFAPELSEFTLNFLILYRYSRLGTEECPRCKRPFVDPADDDNVERTALLADFRWYCLSCNAQWNKQEEMLYEHYPLTHRGLGLECLHWIKFNAKDSAQETACDVCGGPLDLSLGVGRACAPARGRYACYLCNLQFQKDVKKQKALGLNIDTPTGYRDWRAEHIMFKLTKLQARRARRAAAHDAIGDACQYCGNLLLHLNSFFPHPTSPANQPLCEPCMIRDSARCRILINVDSFFHYRTELQMKPGGYQTSATQAPEETALLIPYMWYRRHSRIRCPVTGFPLYFTPGARFRDRAALDHEGKVCRTFLHASINSANFVASLAQQNGWHDLRKWGNHVFDYLTKDHSAAYSETVISEFNAVFSAGRTESKQEFHEMTGTRHKELLNRAMENPDLVQELEDLKARMTTCPITSAPITKKSRLRPDHGHESGKLRLPLPGVVNLFTGCVEAPAKHAARAEYSGPDRNKFLAIFRRHLRRMIDAMVDILIRRPKAIEDFIAAGRADPELSAIMRAHAEGERVSFEPVVKAMESGVLKAATDALDEFYQVQTPTTQERMERMNPDLEQNPMKGYFPQLFNSDGQPYYTKGFEAFNGVGAASTDEDVDDDDDERHFGKVGKRLWSEKAAV